jgi:hypothetical protein
VCFSPELLYSDELYFLLEKKRSKGRKINKGKETPITLIAR